MLPFLLTGALLLFHRASRIQRRWDAPSVAAPKQLLLLSFIAIVSHPLLDALNTYGVRWLMPFSGEWFYGDTLFIIDPWVWLALSLGVYYSSRRQKAKRANVARPPRLALALIALYMAGMALSGMEAKRIVTRDLASGSGGPVLTAMVGPVPLNPLVREFVVEQDGQYRVGTFRWFKRPHVDPKEVLTFPRERPSHPAFLMAVETQVARRFLGWARFPMVEIHQLGERRFVVKIVDLRYSPRRGEGFGTISIPVTLPTAASPSRKNLSRRSN